jgi:IS605 OrfB family transposase
MRKKIKEKMRSNKYILGLIKNSGIYQQTLDNSVKDVYKARKTAISNLKQGNIKFFRLRYKRKNHHIQNMVLETDALGKNGKGLKKKGLTDLKPSSPIKTDRITRIGYNSRTGSITMYVPYDKTTDTQVKREHVCALDPGIRTFQTLYSPSGITYQFGDEKNVIKKTLKRIEKIKNMKDKPWYKRYTRRLREKVKNRIADLHWKTASFLCKNFDNILVGNMSTKGIVKKSLNLHSSNKQMIYALSHFLFKERLKSKAEEYNCFVKIVDESYTSKTCGRCGIINNNLGSSKKFLCPEYMCFYRMDRDIHGARNIYLKNKCFVS